MTMVAYTRPETPREWLELLPGAAEYAKAIANTDFVPKTLRGNPAAITAAILYGLEVGLTPMQSLAKIAVIDGRPTLAAEAQRALILAAGHDLSFEATNTRVTVSGRRRDSDQTESVTWTLDDAKKAKIAGKQNWERYPRQMLLARASAELARAIFADVIGGLAATEELEDVVEVEPAAEPAPEPAKSRRRRRPALAPVSAAPESEPEPQADPEPEPEPAPELITEPQRKKLMAAFREAGFSERPARLAFATVILRRTIASSNELTKDEASTLIDVLEHGHAAEPGENPPEAQDELLRELEDTLDAQEAD